MPARLPVSKEMRPVPGYPDYFITGSGEVWSLKGSEPRKLAISLDSYGYPKVMLYGAHRDVIHIHTLILITFVGPRPEGLQCRHLDGNRKNFAIDNLCWGTPLENGSDTVRHGRSTAGERHPKAKLTEAEIAAIRNRFRSGESLRKLAKELGMSKSNLSDIRSGKTWRQVA